MTSSPGTLSSGDRPPCSDDAPPCAELLADALEALKAGQLPPEFAVEELVHLLERMAPVATKHRQRRALRRVAELMTSGEYPSVRTAAPRVARELGVAPDTVRGWWTDAGGCPPPPVSPQPLRDPRPKGDT